MWTDRLTYLYFKNDIDIAVFDIQDGEVRLKTLLNMTEGHQAIADPSEFKPVFEKYEKTTALHADLSCN